jgi:E3 ubiquitin-protein ligase MARCH6
VAYFVSATFLNRGYADNSDFIRDPDDPTFHPVRDVLERDVTTQLRKIAFSALVYGALVLICLGGVVWGLSHGFTGILPIHWSYKDAIFEFPIDLLFYNFCLPLAIRILNPANALDIMYQWWFRSCARILRLSWFLFDKRRVDEEATVVRKYWRNILKKTDVRIEADVESQLPRLAGEAADDVEVVKSGRYVRAPSSDQVRIVKGDVVFLEVADEAEQTRLLRDRSRTEASADPPPAGENHNVPMESTYRLVYVPPNFKSRIVAFILLVWLFAAATGLSLTVVPLLFGRWLMKRTLFGSVPRNDIYAFSFGAHVLGISAYALVHIRTRVRGMCSQLVTHVHAPASTLLAAKGVIIRVASLLYLVAITVGLLPALFTLIAEAYLVLPIYTYFEGSRTHTVHWMQSWSLGLLYVKLAWHYILWHGDSRLAVALRTVIRHGYLRPDVRVATRCLVLPAVVVAATALLLPLGVAATLLHFDLVVDEAAATRLFRYAYPLLACGVAIVWALFRLRRVIDRWRRMVRDEVYLIGERLHNFVDDGKARQVTGSGT